MFWAVLILVLLSIVLLKLGAMSVWVTVLSGALQFILLGIAVLFVFLGWQRWRRR